MLRDWLADAALLCTVLLLVLDCASPRASSLSRSQPSGSLCLLLAVLFSPAVGCALVLTVGYALSLLLIILQIVGVLLAQSS